LTTRIDSMPVYAARSEQVSAVLYNLWRRARMHLNLPIRIELPELKSTALIIEADHWVLVDPRQYDLPILAWIKFEDEGRSSLHTPVNCTVNYYHYMASQLRNRVLMLLQLKLEQYLHNAEDGTDHM